MMTTVMMTSMATGQVIKHDRARIPQYRTVVVATEMKSIAPLVRIVTAAEGSADIATVRAQQIEVQASMAIHLSPHAARARVGASVTMNTVTRIV